METSARGRTTAAKPKVAKRNLGNGHAAAPELDQKKLLRALQAVRDGDFSVRLAADQTGLGG
ncbi:MAG TPA: hypothetical protein VFS58_14320, partial [Steroidobacteraceae bacterium]|nr:hypothetical protein [Steroidobacteraceae bacterium]